MATVVQPSPAPTQASAAPSIPRPTPLLLASVVGAVVVIGGYLLAAYVGHLIALQVGEVPAVLAFLAVFGGVLGVGGYLSKGKAPKGTRGGIVLAVSLLVTSFFVFRAVAINLHKYVPDYGYWIAVAVLAVCLFGSYRFLVSARGVDWSNAIENQGWLHLFSYKPNQGRRVRRLTTIAVLVIGGTGLWSLWAHDLLGSGEQVLSVPTPGRTFELPVLPAKPGSALVLLAALTVWVGWRLVNVPPFADFLIATEAEMNKVSWSTRRKLVQDTLVVLITCALLTAFLLVIDLFWGWLLSLKFIGVLPEKKATDPTERDASGTVRLKW